MCVPPPPPPPPRSHARARVAPAHAQAQTQLIAAMLISFGALSSMQLLRPYMTSSDNGTAIVLSVQVWARDACVISRRPLTLFVQVFLTMFAGLLTYVRNQAMARNPSDTTMGEINGIGWAIIITSGIAVIVAFGAAARAPAARW